MLVTISRTLWGCIHDVVISMCRRSFIVSGVKVECVLVVGEGDGGVGEDFDRELRVRG